MAAEHERTDDGTRRTPPKRRQRDILIPRADTTKAVEAIEPKAVEPAVNELDAMLRRIDAELADAIDVLQRDGASYARTYATALVSPPPEGRRGDSPRRPAGMPSHVAQLVRQLVMDELHTGTKG